MAYNNGFPTNTTYQTVPNIGYSNAYQNNQNTAQNLNMQQMQPIQMQPQPVFNQITDDRILVNGIENAKLYPIAPNRTETLWDIDGKTFYRINAGVPPRIFKYEEITANNDMPLNAVIDNNEHIQQQQLPDMSNYVQVNDLEAMINRLVDEKIKMQQPEVIDQVAPPKKTLSKARS